MIALLRNNIPIALLLFAVWFGANYLRVLISGRVALLALGIFFAAFFAASYLALHSVGRSFLSAIIWMVVTLVVSAIIIMFTLGLGFTHI